MFTVKSQNLCGSTQISCDGRTQLFDKTGKHLFFSAHQLAPRISFPLTVGISDCCFPYVGENCFGHGQSAVTLDPDDASLMGCWGMGMGALGRGDGG